MTLFWRFGGLASSLLMLTQVGCMAFDRRTVSHVPCTVGEVLVERGEDYPLIDGVGWVVGIPSKILLWNRRVDNHHISPETEEQLRHYMAQNGLQECG
jgi:hypothetical protein